MNTRVTIVGNVDGVTSYGHHMREMVKWLEHYDCHISIRPIRISSDESPIPSQLSRCIVHRPQPEDWEILLAHPNHRPTQGKRTLAVTTWETTRLWPECVAFLNSCEAVVVPSRWNQECFHDSGVTKPIYVVPLGYDPDVFGPKRELRGKDRFVFGAAGRTAHGKARKNLEGVLDAYETAFLAMKDHVELQVKADPTFDLKPFLTGRKCRAIVYTHVAPEKELADWLNGLHCFVSASSGEGFGLWPLQALACGVPVIAPHFGGHTEYLNKQNSIGLDFRLETSGDFYRGIGQWAKVNLAHLSDTMQDALKFFNAPLSERAVKSVKHLTWENSILGLIEVMKEVGMIPTARHYLKKLSEIGGIEKVIDEHASFDLFKKPIIQTQHEIINGLEEMVQDYKRMYEQAVPSVLEQTKYPCAFFEFPETHKTMFLNPGLFELDGQLWLATRRAKHQRDYVFQNDIVLWRLDSEMRVSHPVTPVLRSDYPNQQWEDPRVIVDGKTVYLAATTWVLGSVWPAHQTLFKMDDKFAVKDRLDFRFVGNHPHIEYGTRHEKNWTWFLHDGSLRFVYSPGEDYCVVRPLDAPVYGIEFDFWRGHSSYGEKDKGVSWRFGEARGGTPPVKVGEEYWSFFHSSQGWKLKQRRYFVGCFAFEAKPPFRVTRQSVIPILTGSEEDPRYFKGPCVVFPCGALLRDGKWLVTAGCNDENCFWIEIPHDDLEMSTKKV